MTLGELLAIIYKESIHLRREGSELVVRGNLEALVTSLTGEIRAHKSALLDIVDGNGDMSLSYNNDGFNITPEMITLAQLSQKGISQIVKSVPGGATNVQDIYPLAPLQEGILFHHMMGGEGDPYLLAAQFSFDSEVRLDGYIRALQAVIDRHDILRTAVCWEGLSEPVQVVWRKALLYVEKIGLDPTEGDVAEQLYARFDPRRFRIDVRQAPLLRLYIAYDSTHERWLMMMLLHHLAGDHSTLEVMQAEVQAHLLGRADQLPAPLPFRNLVAQARLGVSPQEHETFFRQMLGDVDKPTAPFGLLDVLGDGTGIEEAHLTLDNNLTRRVRSNARRLGVSAASLCHLAWAQVLAKVSGQEDVVFGTVLFGRMQGGEGSDRVMGLFINTLPVRITIGKEGVEAAVRRTHSLLAGLMLHEHASLALAQRCSAVPAPTPLFSALLNYRHSPDAALDPAKETMQAWEGIKSLRGEERTNYPFTLSVNDLGEGFSLDAQTPSTIDPKRICEFMSTALASLVQALETSPATAVLSLDVLPKSERHRVLYEWNDTKTEFPSDKCVHELFEAQVEKTPDATAVVFEDATLSYAELNIRANRLAHYLRELGVKPDDRVAICVERSLEMIVALMAVLKAGGAYVPLDPAYPIERLRFMIEDSGANIILSVQSLELPQSPGVARVNLDTAILSEVVAEDLRVRIGNEAIAYVMYTSGSTGQSKGVIVPHRAIARLVLNCGYARFNADDRVAFAANPAFDAITMEIFAPLLNGGRIVGISQHVLLDPTRFGQALKRYEVSILWLTVGLFNQYASPLAEIFAHLRYLIIGGDRLNPHVIAQTLRTYPPQHLLNGYGPTEATTFAITYEITDVPDGTDSIPIGRPISNTRVYILDTHGEPVPVGVAGELYIGGAGVARGYLNRPELTAEKFLKDPFNDDPGARMYRTGDLGRWLADGNIEFLGRNDFQVKIRGFRIELGEIEARLMEHPAVREAVVVAREDTPGDKRLVAYYTLADVSGQEEGQIGTEQLRSHLSAVLPEYMVPAAYVQMESLPLTPNGKLDRRALPAPDGGAYATRGYEAPQGEIETKLAEIWAELLSLDRVGRHDNFFELGGHSLMAVRLVTKIQQRFGADLPIREIFAHPVLADLARSIESAAPTELPRIAPAERGSPLPLSFAQQRLWFLAQMDGVSEAYHIPGGLRLKGDLDGKALRRALDRIVARHEALRTTFSLIDGEPVQRIVAIENSSFLLLEHDLFQHDDAQAELDRLVQLEAGASFDLERGPLVRGRLIRLAADEHALLITMHHIVSDGWSMGLLVNELSTLYGAFLRGADDPLPELEIQYADYAVWQRQWIEGEILQQQAAYWKSALAGVPALLELPTDHPRPAQQDYAGGFVELKLDAKLTAALKSLGRKHGTTLFMTLLAAWAALLSRLSGQQDVVSGTATANRGRAEIENLIGFFVNTLALRLDLSGSPTVAELLAQARAQAVAAQQHQDIPFEQVVELANPVRSLAHSPLFQVMFDWQNATEDRLELPGLELLPLKSSPYRVAKFDLRLFLEEGGDCISGGIEYATSLFEQGTIERYLGCFHALLEAMVADDTQTVDQLPMLSESERHRVLYEWNDTKTEFPSDKCVHELFEAQVEKTPDATAVVFEDATLSYAELNIRANRLAHYLRELGVKPDDRVAICVERSLEMIVALMAVLKAGGAYVPLDPAYPIERLRFMLEDAAPVALLTQGHLTELFDGLDEKLPVLDLTAAAPAWNSLPDTNPDPDAFGLNPNHLAYIIYTSGSTGNPKGVMVQHRGLCNYLQWAIATYYSSHAIVSSSLSFDATVTSLYVPLLCGGAIRLLRDGEEIDGLYAQLRRAEGCGLVKLTPGHLNMLGQRMLSEGMHASGNVLVVGGEELAPSTIRLWRQIQTDARLVNEYGPTETVVGCVVYDVPQEIDGTDSIPIGRPISNTQIYILDAHGQPVPVGIAGELYIGGVQVARGYLNRPELTAEKFLKDPFNDDPGARMYRTGDLGRWLADGNIEFLGRNDFQVKIRGFRIELGEIEARLMEHPAVREAVVVAREDTPGDKRLVAYYTLADVSGQEEGQIGAEQLRSHLSAVLPEYMVPAAYVQMESLPLTPNGKLDRRALPAPDGGAYATRGYEAPQGEIETKLAEIWAELLSLDRVGRHDNFFELGGHSLMAVQAIMQLQHLNIEVSIDDVFSRPVLADLALGIATIKPTELPRIAPAERGSPLPLSFAQQRLWFLAQMDGVSEAYHIPGGLRLKGDLDGKALRRALDRIVARHEALRTTFSLIDGEPVQRIVAIENSSFLLLEHDLFQHDDAQAELDRLVQLEAGASFDLERGPLVRGRLIRLAADEHALLITMHHIVSDGWSMGLLVNELSTLYGAFLRGADDPLPELEIQYADYAVWQRQWIEGEILQQQAAYWKSALAGVPALLELPTDHPRPAQQDYAGGFVELKLDAKLTAALKSLGRKHGTTLFMTLLAAWAALLSRLSGQQDVVSGTATANRGRAEIENLIGFFVNTLALRLDLSGSPTVAELLAQARAQAVAAQQHQDIPFEQVVELANPVRSLAHSPLFQVMFDWQNATEDRLELPGLELLPLKSSPYRVAKFDLRLFLEEGGDCISGGIEYATSLFEQGTIERYLGCFHALLEAMVADDTQTVDQLPMLSESERHRVLYEWNDTKTEFPSDKCVHELFEAQVEKTPDATAVVFEDATLSYAELNIRANRLAHYLRELGVKPDDRVAICVERSLEMIVALMAVLKAGGAYVPLDPAYPIERLRFMLEDAAPVALLTQGHLTELFDGLDEKLPVLDLTAAAPAWNSLPDTNPDPDAFGLNPNHLAYIIYTSGSTGNPKGVMVQHRGVVNRLAWMQNAYELNPRDAILQKTPFGFDVSVWEFFWTLLAGAKLVMARPEGHKAPEYLAEVIRKNEITTIHFVPSMLQSFLEYADLAGIFTLVRIVCSGEALPAPLLRRFHERLPHAILHNLYGPTEAAVDVTAWTSPDNLNQAIVPIGRPISNTQIYILDAHGQPVPVGIAGELYIGGVQVARGYLNRPELTAEKFLKDPFNDDPGARMYRTGDLGRWLADGNIEFLGRNDFQVKIRGFRVELGEIEARLMEHPAVREAVVVAREDTPGDKRLVAYYTLADVSGQEEGQIGAEQLRSHLSAVLPEYMVPAAYVQMESLPLTPNGKLDRRALPAPDGGAYATRGYEAPQGEIETKLAEIWAELLSLDRVGRHDNFFELGGHSLMAVRVVNSLRQAGDIGISIRDLFMYPELSLLADHILDLQLGQFSAADLHNLLNTVNNL